MEPSEHIKLRGAQPWQIGRAHRAAERRASARSLSSGALKGMGPSGRVASVYTPDRARPAGNDAGRGKMPETITGTGEDELAAMIDLRIRLDEHGATRSSPRSTAVAVRLISKVPRSGPGRSRVVPNRYRVKRARPVLRAERRPAGASAA